MSNVEVRNLYEAPNRIDERLAEDAEKLYILLGIDRILGKQDQSDGLYRSCIATSAQPTYAEKPLYTISYTAQISTDGNSPHFLTIQFAHPQGETKITVYGAQLIYFRHDAYGGEEHSVQSYSDVIVDERYRAMLMLRYSVEEYERALAMMPSPFQPNSQFTPNNYSWGTADF